MITVTIGNKKIGCEPGTELGEIVRGRGAGVGFVCGGHGKCGKCRIVVRGSVSAVTDAEKKFLTDGEIAAGVRLACRTRATGDCEIVLPDAGDTSLTVRIDGECEGFAPEPCFEKYGIAIDIGTTTVAAKLFDAKGNILAKDGVNNPQAKWGADVISRMESSMAGNGAAITAAIREALSGLIAEMSDTARISSADIDGAVITGNTVMLHLLTGTDVRPLTRAPFEARDLFGRDVKAGDIGIDALLPETCVYLAPCAGAFIGADTVCAALATGTGTRDGCELMADIGTNGEILLSVGDRLFACSTAAGPAFEGAGISMGMGGFDGAIDRAFVDGSGSISVGVIGSERGAAAKGICGSGLIDLIACLLKTGAIDETGCIEEDARNRYHAGRHPCRSACKKRDTRRYESAPQGRRLRRGRYRKSDNCGRIRLVFEY